MFDRQLLRLSMAFASVPQRGMGDEYWSRLKNHNYDLFVLTVEKLLDESDRFPTIATIHREYYKFRDMQRELDGDRAMPRDAALEAGRRNAARLAREGLPSDVMLAKGWGVTHAVGSAQHEAILGTYDKMARTLMYQIDERSAQADANPNDRDLARRVGVLVQTLSDTEKRRAHFAATGETLPLVELAPDAVGVTPGTLYLCPICRATDDAPGRFVRVEGTAGSAHFGRAIPCPRCRADLFAEYVQKYGRPQGLDDWEVRDAAD